MTQSDVATVEAWGGNEQKITDEDNAEGEVILYDVSIEKTVDDATITVGQETSFTITVQNTGNQPLYNVLVKDTIPAELTYVSSAPSPSAASDPDYEWTFDLAAGETKVISVLVQGASVGVYDNVATVEAWGGNEQKLADEDDAPGEVIPVPTYGLNIDKTVDDSTITVGDDTRFTITVQNTGNQPLYGVVVKDTIPGELLYMSSDPLPVVASDPFYQWTFDLAAGETKVISVLVKGTSVGHYDNVATVEAWSRTEEFLTDEDNAPGEVEAEPTYSVEITKIDTVDPVMVGENTDYIISVKNTGTGDLTKVNLTDALPGAFSYVSDSGASTLGSDGYSWDLGMLKSGDTTEVLMTTKAVTVGTHTNIATVTAAELKDPVSSPQPTTVLAVPVVLPAVYDVSIKKTDDVDPAYIGDIVHYKVTVKNEGDQPLTGLVLSDTLPSGLKYVKADVSGVTVKDGVISWSEKSLEPGESRVFTITTKAAKSGHWVNTASVKANEIPTPRTATQKTHIIAAAVLGSEIGPDEVAEATPITQSSETLPYTGFPLTIWWLTAAAMLAAGLWLEIKVRAGRRLND